MSTNNEYKLSYTGEEINKKLSMIDDSNVLPKVTINNNGAFLRVINGVWSVSPLTNAEEVAF